MQQSSTSDPTIPDVLGDIEQDVRNLTGQVKALSVIDIDDFTRLQKLVRRLEALSAIDIDDFTRLQIDEAASSLKNACRYLYEAGIDLITHDAK